jgi:LmbE family N-acetylglucosaminyl deacetylase
MGFLSLTSGRRVRWAVPLLLALVGCIPTLLVPARAQVRPTYDLGSTGLWHILQRLQTTATVLHVAAHPDDEDAPFVARVARGDHARVAYLSLTRGDGGQNVIGPELSEALGVIRTEELLQARRLYGAEQFFTRAFDFGYSKSREETAARWNEREVLGDMVRVIRAFRPLVIYSQWSGTPADGHGHHQLAGHLTPLAFKAAADPNEFPEQMQEGLNIWQPRKLFRRLLADEQPTVRLQTGVFDPVLGRTYAAIANEGRSQHKSQGFGRIETRGPASSDLRAIEGLASTSIFDGLDLSVSGLAKLVGLPDGALRPQLTAIEAAAGMALREYQPLDPARSVAALVQGLKAVREARQRLQSLDVVQRLRADADFFLAFKEQDFAAAILQASGVTIDPVADIETMTPGSTLAVEVRAFLAEPARARVASLTLKAPAGWIVRNVANPKSGPTTSARETPTQYTSYQVTVPATAPLTQPYFLEEPRQGDRYRWPPDAPKGAPFAPPLLVGEARVRVDDVEIVASEPVTYRFADPVRGEIRRVPAVVPKVTVRVDAPLFVIPLGSSPHRQRIVAQVTSFSRESVNGTMRLRVPPGWTASPPEAPFTLKAAGEQVSTAFTITAPPTRTSGPVDIEAEARIGDVTFARELQLIAYPHIETHRLYWPARARAQIFDYKVAKVRLGYVMGSGDLVPEAIRRMGVDVTLLDAEMLETGNLSQFDTIVVGIRASETRPDFVANNGRLLRYVEGGGTLIVQYQQNEYGDQNLPPYAASVERNSRVSDERAPVKILAPGHPVFTFPNRITADDFNGWAQERNLYAFTEFDQQRYTPLLESSDPGESPQRGGQLYAEIGKGRYVYTAYAWFRQLPAGVPGAYRQFANLISLSKAPR